MRDALFPLRVNVKNGYTPVIEATKRKGGIAIRAPSILAYNLAPEREKEILRLAMLHKMRLQSVPKADQNQKLSALTGLSERQEAPAGETFDDELLVFCFLTSQQLNDFLSAFGRHGIARVRLKAVLTETNSQWDAVQLHRELSEEDAWFKANKGPRHEQ